MLTVRRQGHVTCVRLPHSPPTEEVCLRQKESHNKALNVVVPYSSLLILILLQVGSGAPTAVEVASLTKRCAPCPTPPNVSTPTGMSEVEGVEAQASRYLATTNELHVSRQ